MQEVLDVSNEVAAELAASGTACWRASRPARRPFYLRGDELTLDGDEAQVVVRAPWSTSSSSSSRRAGDRAADRRRRERRGRPAEGVRDILDDVVWRQRGKRITPKTLDQKHYVDAIRNRTVTFGIGPAGTGKTYLAIALAVAALARPRGRRASSSRGRRSRRASGSASCPATCSPRSTRTCARCSTRSTTCSTPSG